MIAPVPSPCTQLHTPSASPRVGPLAVPVGGGDHGALCGARRLLAGCGGPSRTRSGARTPVPDPEDPGLAARAMSSPLPDPYERVPRPGSRARAAYNRSACWYDLPEGWWEHRPRLQGLGVLAACSGERALEVGPGTGHALAQLAERLGPDGRVLGLDLAERRPARTRRRLAKAAAALRPHLVQGDAVRLPIATGSLDAVSLSFVLELSDTPEIPIVLGECLRVPGPAGEGRVARAVHPRRHRRRPRLLDCRPIPLQSLLMGAGFRAPYRERLRVWGLPVAVVPGWKGEPDGGRPPPGGAALPRGLL